MHIFWFTLFINLSVQEHISNKNMVKHYKGAPKEWFKFIAKMAHTNFQKIHNFKYLMQFSEYCHEGNNLQWMYLFDSLGKKLIKLTTTC